MARHGFIVEVANVVGTEPAIIESSLAYRAERYGKRDGSRISFSVSIDELEKCYEYFIFGIDECFENLEDLALGDETVYSISIAEVGQERIACVSVLAKWIELRRSL